MADEKSESAVGTLTKWIAVLSAAATLGMSIWNGFNANKIEQFENDLKNRQFELSVEKERLQRFAFVQKLFDGVLSEEEGKRTLTVNLINLTLQEDEAQQFFAGLQTSQNEAIREAGELGAEARMLSTLVRQMNDRVRSTRIESVQALIEQYRADSDAISLAVRMLQPPALDELSPSGRINVLVFLRNTDIKAWNGGLVRQARDAVANIRTGQQTGMAAVGPQTEDALTQFEQHLDKFTEL